MCKATQFRRFNRLDIKPRLKRQGMWVINSMELSKFEHHGVKEVNDGVKEVNDGVKVK